MSLVIKKSQCLDVLWTCIHNGAIAALRASPQKTFAPSCFRVLHMACSLLSNAHWLGCASCVLDVVVAFPEAKSSKAPFGKRQDGWSLIEILPGALVQSTSSAFKH